jgi:dUTP pyrophosphatase
MHLIIVPGNEEVQSMYKSHTTFHEGDAGVDLFVVEDCVVPPRAMAMAFKLDFNIRCSALSNVNKKYVPSGFLLAPRSSISKTPLRMSNSVGIIDSGYRGNIMAMVDNISDEPYSIKKGDRLFQIVDPQMLGIELTVNGVDFVFPPTSRGTGGFGSTNK